MTWRLVAAAFAACIVAAGVAADANEHSPFVSMTFSEHREYTLSCAAHYECDVQLDAGERVNDGFNAHIDQWDPHIGYSGDKELTPHLVLRPSRPGLRTNIILTTTKRTYYLLAVSTRRERASYYSFVYGDETYKKLAELAIATQTALRAANGESQPVPTATPANVATLQSTCFDFDYSYLVDPNAQSDRTPRGRPSSDKLPPELVPQVVCSDGSHTFIQFPQQREVPSDLPISLAVTAEGDTLINYTYLASLNRFTVDGVYDSFVLEVGSQSRPLRLRIFHAGRGSIPSGRRDPKPKPVIAPATYASSQTPGGVAFSGGVPTLGPAVVASVAPSATPTAAPVASPSPAVARTAAPAAAAQVQSAPAVMATPVAPSAVTTPSAAPSTAPPVATRTAAPGVVAAARPSEHARKPSSRRRPLPAKYAWLRKYDRPAAHRARGK